MLHHKACDAGAESTEIIAPNMSGAYTHIFSLHATGPQHLSTPYIELLKLLASVVMHMTSKLMDEAISYHIAGFSRGKIFTNFTNQ